MIYIAVTVGDENSNNVVSESKSVVPWTVTASDKSQTGVGQFINTNSTMMLVSCTLTKLYLIMYQYKEKSGPHDM